MAEQGSARLFDILTLTKIGVNTSDKARQYSLALLSWVMDVDKFTSHLQGLGNEKKLERF